MKYIITDTTDKKYIGHIINYDKEENLFICIEDLNMYVEEEIRLGDKEIRISNSNYSMDLREV
jgi:hypothetical protein